MAFDFYKYLRYICDNGSRLRKVMKDNPHSKPNTRMIHVRIPEDLHKRLRIQAAERDTTLQDWVAMVIRKELDRQDAEKNERTS